MLNKTSNWFIHVVILIFIDDSMPTDFPFTVMAESAEAQTLANVYLALENNLEIIPVRPV